MVIESAKKLPNNTNNEAKLLAVIHRLLLCKKIGVHRLDVEGDLALVVNVLRLGSTPNWKLQAILDQVMELLASLESFTINHIY